MSRQWLTALALSLASLARAEVQSLARGWSAYHTCALSAAGGVKCWGHADGGRIGTGDESNRGDGADEMGSSLPELDLGDGRTAAEVAVGIYATCARLDTGAVKCWGVGNNGRLGYGDTIFRGDEANEMGNFLPEVDLGGLSAVQVIAGNQHFCARLSDGSLKCWGINDAGQLGLGDTNDRGDQADEMGSNLPTVDLGAGRTAVHVTAGDKHTCALLDNDDVICWGRADLGALGHYDSNNGANMGDEADEMGSSLATVDFGAGRRAKEIVRHGQLGLGDTTTRGKTAAEMGDNLPALAFGTDRTAVEISAGDRFFCARLDNGSWVLWDMEMKHRGAQPISQR
ncbi:HERC3 [Symbiodinium microadriaticum]|nr:HERC3 [Symbiodinium microadriaticum]